MKTFSRLLAMDIAKVNRERGYTPVNPSLAKLREAFRQTTQAAEPLPAVP